MIEMIIIKKKKLIIIRSFEHKFLTSIYDNNVSLDWIGLKKIK